MALSSLRLAWRLKSPLVFHIVWEVIAPIFLLIGVGYLVQKRLGFDLKTLTRLNFWVFVPAFLFVRIYESKLSVAELGRILAHFGLFFGLLALSTWVLAGICGVQPRLRRALTASVLFYNSGNYGIPVAQLAFPGVAIALQVQAAMVMLQNIANFTIGLLLVAGGKGKSKRETLGSVFKLPMIYVLLIAEAMRAGHIPLPLPLETGLHTLEKGLVPIALVTLGAQMAALKAPPLSGALLLSLGLRLIFAPVLGYAVILGLGIHGALARSLLVSTAFPTAVNAALLALEFDNEPEFVAAAVFYSTLISTLSVSFVIYAAQHWI